MFYSKLSRLSLLLLAFVLVGWSPPNWALDGTASYYAEQFHGRRTASGTRFDMNAMTAAHKTWSFGTLVKVTNKANGRSVVVTITDRGPYIAGRVIDVSKGAARELGMMGSGVARVRLEVVGKGSGNGLREARQTHDVPVMAALDPDNRLVMDLF